MGEFYPFPHLEHLSRYPEIYALNRVIITEKIHGTNARFGLVDGQFRVGGRNTELDDKNTNFGFYQWAGDLEQRLRDAMQGSPEQDVIIYGEWCGPKIQKGIVYAQEKQFWAFVVRMGKYLLPVLEGLEIAAQLGLHTVPVARCVMTGGPAEGDA